MDDLKALRTFVEVVKAGSMADAAVARRCTGAAVSQQIARLESEFGTRLLERHRDGVTTTVAGMELMRRATALLGSIADMERAVHDAIESTAGVVRLTAFSSACVRVLPSVLKDIRRDNPDLELMLVGRYEDGNPFEGLVHGETDFLIFHEYDYVSQERPNGVEVSMLGRDIVDAVVPLSHSLAHQHAVRLSDLSNEEWVLFPTGNIGTLSTTRACKAAGFSPNITFEAGDYQVVLSLVANNCGVSAQPRLVTDKLRRSHAVLPFKHDVMGRTIGVAWRTDGKTKSIVELERAFRHHFNFS